PIFRFDDYDPGVVRDRCALQPEALTRIDHRDHIATQIDDAQHVAWRTRNRCNLGIAQHFLNLHHIDAIGLVIQTEGHPLQDWIIGTLRGSHLHSPTSYIPPRRSIQQIDRATDAASCCSNDYEGTPFRWRVAPLAISSASSATSSSAHIWSMTVPANQGRWVR